MISPIIRLNGNLLTRKSVSIRLSGVIRLTAVDSCDWSDEVPTELVEGMTEGGPPLGKAQGPYTCSASLGVYLDYAGAFESAVLASDPVGAVTGGGNLSRCNFQIMIIAREDARVNAVTLVDCSIKGRATTVGNDGSALVKTYQLQPRIVLENGLSLVRMTPAL